jgi:hypothetical protein
MKSTGTDTTATTTTSTTIITTTPAPFTVPTSAGFTALANSPDYRARKRDIDDGIPAVRHSKPRGLSPRAANVIKCPPVGKPGQFSPQIYPTSTICGTLVRAYTTFTKSYPAQTTATTTLSPQTSITTVGPEYPVRQKDILADLSLRKQTL